MPRHVLQSNPQELTRDCSLLPKCEMLFGVALSTLKEIFSRKASLSAVSRPVLCHYIDKKNFASRFVGHLYNCQPAALSLPSSLFDIFRVKDLALKLSKKFLSESATFVGWIRCL